MKCTHLKCKMGTVAHPWFGGYSTSIYDCGVWGARAGVQIFRRKFHTHIHLKSVWFEGWKNGRIENCGMIEKWENRKDFIFSHFCLVESGKVEEWKKWVWINLLIYSC